MLTRKSIDTDTLYNVSRALNYDLLCCISIHKEQINYDNVRAGIQTLHSEGVGGA